MTLLDYGGGTAPVETFVFVPLLDEWELRPCPFHNLDIVPRAGGRQMRRILGPVPSECGGRFSRMGHAIQALGGG